MPRFLLALTVTLTTLTFTLALTARTWGETQPAHPALRGFVEGCEGIPQPCWYGINIRPGTLVSPEVVKANLAQEGYVIVYEGVTVGDRQLPYQEYRALDIVSTCDFTLMYEPESNKIAQAQVNCLGRDRGVRTGDLLQIWGMPDSLNPDPNPTFFYESESAAVLIETATSLLAPLRLIVLPAHDGDYKWYGLVPAWRIRQLESRSRSGGY